MPRSNISQSGPEKVSPFPKHRIGNEVYWQSLFPQHLTGHVVAVEAFVVY